VRSSRRPTRRIWTPPVNLFSSLAGSLFPLG
jgi:hypothetical protein